MKVNITNQFIEVFNPEGFCKKFSEIFGVGIIYRDKFFDEDNPIVLNIMYCRYR